MSSKPLPNPKWVDYSSGLIGYNEATHRQLIMSWARDIGPDYWSMNFDPSQDQSDWQTLFVAHCLKRCGGSLPKNHLIAQEWLAYGDLLKQPYLGSLIIVMSQDVFHIGFAVGITPDGQLVMRGATRATVSSTWRSTRSPCSSIAGLECPDPPLESCRP